MPTETKQMDAVVIKASGPPAQSLAFRSEPVPEPGPGEVLVEVHAAAVNPLDIANAAGQLGTPLPMIPGSDFAGVVVSGGDLAGRRKPGGAEHFIDTTSGDLREAVLALTGGRGADMVLDAVGGT